MEKSFGHFCIVLTVLSLFGCSQGGSGNRIQNTHAAVRYFEDELSFTTNPFGVQSVVFKKRQDVTIVDVRKEADYKMGHIPGAINIPFDQWNSFEGDQKHFTGLIKNGFNYVYCYELLCNLAQKAGKKFASLGYPTKEIKGGFKSWKEHEYPVEK